MDAYQVEHIEKLMKGDWHSLVPIYLSLSHPKNKNIPICVKAIKEYFLSCSHKEIITLSEEFGKALQYSWRYGESAHSPNQMIPEQCDKESLFALLSIGTFHSSGYFRETCMLELEKFGTRGLLFLFY